MQKKKILKKSVEFFGKTINFETGKIASQADGSVVISCGRSVLLATTVFSKKPFSDPVDFLPLNVHYREMFSASGKIPGGFIKRETKPSNNEVLISRLIDRSIRPMLPKDFQHEIQVIVTVLSYEAKSDPAFLAVMASSASVAISGLPFMPVCCTRVSLSQNKLVFNPNLNSDDLDQVNLLLSGTEDKITMLEGCFNEITEDKISQIISHSTSEFSRVIKVINEIKKDLNKKDYEFTQNVDDKNLECDMREYCHAEVTKFFYLKTKKERSDFILHIKNNLKKKFVSENISENKIESVFEKIKRSLIRDEVLNNKNRILNRKVDEVRSISSEINFLPGSHGSGIFTRGNTQVISTVTLGSIDDQQIQDNMRGVYKESFLLYYNFLGYSSGECFPVRAPSRREIGHGNLALQAIKPVLPKLLEEFPHVVRVSCEITESDGSTSMATVCSSILALMDAGVPIRKMVSGIAMGLIMDKENYVILSDIEAEEDFSGDMDFKIAGTDEGVTALQMDVKLPGISKKIIKEVLLLAKEGRKKILNRMQTTISTPNSKVSDNVDKVHTIKIEKESIRSLIGPGGRVIKDICDSTSSKISIEEDGTVNIIVSQSSSKIEDIIKKINAVTKKLSVGDKISVVVTKIIPSGVIVNYAKGKDGYIHISQISNNQVNNISDHVKLNQKLDVVVVEVFNNRVKFSIKDYNKNITEIRNKKNQFNNNKFNIVKKESNFKEVVDSTLTKTMKHFD